MYWRLKKAIVKRSMKTGSTITNSNAIRAVAAAVEGPGPQRFDIMLADRFGEVTITNDGVTILKQMDINHPAAKMLINIARASRKLAMALLQLP